jgi:fucose permease
MGQRRQWTAVIFLFVLGDGMVAQLRGSLLPNIQQTFTLSEGLLGLVTPASTVGLVAAVLLVGMWSGRLDVRRTVLLGTGSAAACLLFVSAADTYEALLATFLLQGATLGVVRALDRPLLGHFYPDRRGQVFNLYALVWALGATGGPLFANAILAVGDWRLAYLLVAAVFLTVAIAVLRLSRPETGGTEASLSLSDLWNVLRLPSVQGMATALVVSGAVEGTVFTWLPYYASQFFPQSTANLLLSGFLFMYVPGRLGYAVLADRLRPLNLVLFLAVAAVPVVGVAFFAGAPTGLVVGVLCFGLLVAGFFPTLSAFGVGSAPRYSGPVNAIATAANFAGLSIAPVLVGVVASRYDIGTGMGLLLPALGCLAVVIAVTRLRLAGPDAVTGEA